MTELGVPGEAKTPLDSLTKGIYTVTDEGKGWGVHLSLELIMLC